ncbi:hypothetical protein AArcSl_2769 [Halalkaliarchaeum desulfuricum]|uniref:SipW-cognate class signal peptide n=1 Tax=Halalkaliarchaeum desulfuricum TaxID=2055893 RepID=A0A343TMR2_9EURY|nr:SipW-dependent-type signal peptide-containing protein [Halalkaliarchaeum desulfuricum]AUX10384.1 hypothetical protein AArcSl_2769 [Halalkaliarchaeum desulfuricum]
MSKEFQLSRRKALVGLGTVGVASAGAGFGTSAYFSDQEEFTGNSIQAGEFELTVELLTGESTVDQDGIGPDEEIESWASAVGDDGAEFGMPITISDAKPGDTYEFYWEITINENPGYVQVEGDVQEDEPGGDEDDDRFEELGVTPIPLGQSDNITATVAVGDEVEDGEWSGAGEFSSETFDGEGLGELFDALDGDGLALRNEDGELLTIGPNGDYDSVVVCVEIVISTEAGNEIQNASHASDLRFYAEQARHNEEFRSD